MAAEGCYRYRMKEGLQQTLQSAAILRDSLALVSVIRPLTSRPIAPLQAIVLMDSSVGRESDGGNIGYR